jgi:hypothetical protein
MRLNSLHPRHLLRSRLLHRLHTDDRGNLGVLLLLTVWALVALLGLVWNSGEYATRKRQVQAAADSAAQAGNMWVSRTTNSTTATNLVMSENGSAEVILRSVAPTTQAIQTRITSEQTQAKLLEQGNTPNDPEKNIPDCEYFEQLLGFGAWSGNGQGDQLQSTLSNLTPPVQQAVQRVLPFLNKQQQQQVLDQVIDHLRRNNVGLGWLNGTWVGGQAPASDMLPPAVNGGLRSTVSAWITGQVRTRLDDIISTVNTQQSTLNAFEDQTAPATNGTTPEDLQQKRSEIFEYQQQIVAMTPSVVDEQRSALSTFYNCDLTYATPGHPSDDGGPAMVQPPLQPASDVQSQSRSDSIREKYPEATLAKFGTSDPTVTIDPINVNVDNNVIWDPGATEPAPPGLTLGKQQFHGTFQVSGGEWGHVPCAPLSWYFNDRVSRDEQGLRTEPQSIDQTRSSLGGRINPVPPPPTLPTLPRSIPDPQPKKPAIPIPPEAIGAIPTPQGLTAADLANITQLNTQISQFNQNLRTYVNDLQGLQSSLQAMYNNVSTLATNASQQFADQTWLNSVNANRALVLEEMGNAKQFMVLSTYALHQIPDWALSGMHDNVYQYVYQQVIANNVGPLTQQLQQQLKQWALGVLQAAAAAQPGTSGKSSRQQIQSQAQQFANQNASAAAQYIAQEAAAQIAEEVAGEWVARPWPYEITPPPQAVPPTNGLTADDRQHYFTVLSAAKTNDQSAPKPVLTQTFPASTTPMVAFAQGENFNWMEYNGTYGGGDVFDNITQFGHGDMGGFPRPWRLSTTGGWNWQPRLALSDALYQAIQDGPEFQSFLSQGGVTGNDQDSINTLTLH